MVTKRTSSPGRHARIDLPTVTLGRTGLRISRLCLGTMTFGAEWGWGADPSESRKIFEAFAEHGGNFVDTANNYTNGQSEELVGDFIRSDRERFVVGTKFSLSTRADDPNSGGNHRKNLVRSLERSLRTLGTDYVDVYWLHVWDFLTAVDDVMRALDDVVRAGKALYVGVSDTPAWIVSQANAIADLRGWSRFVGLQAEYSLVNRDAERDLLPMARALGMTVLPWSPLGNGILTGKYNRQRHADGRRLDDDSRSRNRPTERGLSIAEEVIQVADRVGATPSQVALAWLLQSSAAVVPVIGCRTVDQAIDNLGSVEVVLADDDVRGLDDVSRIELGFPHDFLAAPFTRTMVHGDTYERLIV